ncbi:2-acylglycerol O-acyltransferase 3 isoform X2 [Ursus arctos]|uniref:2-acylglycerol O-acyltransferase 3 isoform X2 n=1 Tax=Ursus arctos TaxID=9644 RepID=UPI002017110D|nr:2-acylglycerol O-acyltransferase 3 isoform X2 [Ursus arctos]
MKVVGKLWLETLGAYQYVLTFLFMGPFFSLLLLFLLFTSFWSVPVLYFVWFFLDWDTPNQGGRQFEWIKKFFMWKYTRDYFPIKMVKTAELPPDRNYVVGAHPHGIMAFGTFINFCANVDGFFKKFPGIRASLAGQAILFYFPVSRDYFMANGPPWYLCTPLGRTISSILSFLTQTPGSISVSSPSRRSWAFLLASSGAADSSRPTPGACCPSPGPSPPWWGTPSRCPSAWTPPRRKLTTITRSTWRLWSNSLRTTRKAAVSQLLLASPLSSPCCSPQP